jgi:uncharacterized protein involved in exopolysaccharide biosynthesis
LTYPRDLPVLATTSHLSLAMAQAAPFMQQQYAQPGMSATQIAAILWAHRKQTLLIASAVILLAVAAAALWPRTYEANATLMVNFEVNDPLSGREFPVGLLSSYMATQVELARSSEVLLPVIDRLKLTEHKEYAAGYSGDPDGLRDWVETRVRKKLLVEQGKFGSQLIYVTYAAGKPKEAAQVANAIAEVYSEKQYSRLTGPASERAERYTRQLAELKGKVASAQQQVVEFRQRTGVTADQSAGNEALGPAMIHSIKTQLATQNVSMAQLRATMGPRHPEVLALQSQINANRQALNAELGAYSGNAAAELESRQHQLELESAQSVYKRALDGYDQVKLASLGGYTNIDFVSRATPPFKASKPKVMIILLLAGFAGVGLGIAIPLCLDLLNRRVRCRDDMERDLGIPVLMELGSLGPLANYPVRSAA